VCGIVIHSFIIGQPYRVRRFRAALERLAPMRDSVWVTTPGQIAAHYESVQPPPAVAPSAARSL
jgi:hypothetical protein